MAHSGFRTRGLKQTKTKANEEQSHSLFGDLSRFQSVFFYLACLLLFFISSTYVVSLCRDWLVLLSLDKKLN